MIQINKLEKVGLVLLGVALMGLLTWWAFSILPVFGSAPSGLPASNASSSPIAVAAGTVTTPVATSTTCAARVVATASTTIMVQVGGDGPTASAGYFQAASTTVIYDGGIYGCGALKVFPFSTGAITVMETQ